MEGSLHYRYLKNGFDTVFCLSRIRSNVRQFNYKIQARILVRISFGILNLKP